MDCSSADDYLNGRLSGSENREFEAHAQSCDSCSKIVARKAAIERAQSVLKRNASARGETPRQAAAPAYVAPRAADASPTKAVTEESPARAPRAPTSALDSTPQEPPSTPNRTPIVIGVVAVVVVGAAIVLWPKSEAKDEKLATKVAPVVQQPPPTPPRPPEQTPPPPAPEPVKQAEPTVAEAPTPTPDLQPVVAATPAIDPKAPQPDLPLDTDYSTLATVVASPRCGPAINALQARVAKNANDAKSWALLVTCYGKRHRWKNVTSSYNHLLEVGDSEQIESVQSWVTQAQAALTPAQPAADASATPAPTATE